MVAKGLKVKIAGDASGAQRAMSVVARDSSTMGQKVGRAAGLIAKAGAAIGAAMGAGAAAAGKSWLDFDDKLTQSTAIVTNLTDEQREAMERAARAVGKTTTISATQAAEAYYFLASAGMDVEQQIAALPAVARFAQAGMFDMATATDLATDAQSALGLKASDAQENLENLTRVTDVLVQANVLANASAQQFSEALTNKAGAALKVTNKDMEEGVAVLAAYADQGVKGEAAGEALAIVLRDVARAGSANAEEFAKMGLSVFDAQGNLKNVADIVDEVTRVLGPMSDAEQAAAFDSLGLTRAVGGNLKVLMGTGDAIRGYEAELRAAGGTTDNVAQKQLQGLKASLKLAWAQVQDLGLTLGEKLAPALRAAGEWVVDNSDKLEGFADVLMGAVADGVRWAEEHLLPVWEALGDWWAANGPTVLSGLETVGGILKWVAEKAAAVATVLLSEGWSGLPERFRQIATVVGVVLAPAFLGMALAAGQAGIATVVAFTKAQVAAVKAGYAMVGTTAKATVAGVQHAAFMVRYGVMVAAQWAKTAAAAVRAGASTVAMWVKLGVQAAASAARTAAAFVVQVAKWAWAGAQSLLHAAKIAAAWLIAMGPIALVIAAVVGIVALIVRNWDTIARVTRELWEKVKAWFGKLKDSIVAAASAAVDWLKRNWDMLLAILTGPFGLAVLAIRRHGDKILEFVKGLPGRITGALRNLGTLLVSKGRDLIGGFISGLRQKASDIVSAIRETITDKLPNFVKSALGIASPSKVFARLGNAVSQGLAVGIKASGSDALKATGTVVAAVTKAASGVQLAPPSLPVGRVPSVGVRPDAALAAAMERVELLVGGDVSGLTGAKAAQQQRLDAGRPVNVTVELDSRVLLEVMGPAFVDEIRATTGTRL